MAKINRQEYNQKKLHMQKNQDENEQINWMVNEWELK
jgi:hypothetical protein